MNDKSHTDLATIRARLLIHQFHLYCPLWYRNEIYNMCDLKLYSDPLLLRSLDIWIQCNKIACVTWKLSTFSSRTILGRISFCTWRIMRFEQRGRKERNERKNRRIHHCVVWRKNCLWNYYRWIFIRLNMFCARFFFKFFFLLHSFVVIQLPQQ